MNTYSQRQIVIAFVGILLGLLSLVPLMAEAKSETWEKTFDSGNKNTKIVKGVYFYKNYDGEKYNCKGGFHVDKDTGEKKPCGYSKMVLTSVAVTYSVKVTRKDTGAIVPDGGTVPVGTDLILEFDPYEDKDTRWVGDVLTWGGYTDSPHGKWVGDTPGTTFSGAKCDYDDFLSKLHDRVNSEVRYYGRYHVKRPDRNITNLGGLNCGSLQGREMNCTVTSPGTFTPHFNFSATDSRFWAMEKDNFKGDGACTIDSDAINVNAVSIPYTIIGSQPNRPPTTPVIDGATTGKPNTSYMFGAKSTDPDDDTIRYGVDINGDNSGVDMWVPSTGYVPSGARKTYSNPASFWSTIGAKKFSVLAEDDNGARSGWARHTITLSVDGTEPPIEDPDDPDDPGGPGGDPRGEITSCPSGYMWDAATSKCKSQTCFDSYYCQGTNLYRGVAGIGPICDGTFVRACAYGCSLGACSAPPGPQIILWEVKPTLGVKGYKTTIKWNAVDVESCTVTGTNGYEAPGNGDTVNAVGEEEDTVNFETTYTLTCEGLDGTTEQKQTTVRLAPIQNED